MKGFLIKYVCCVALLFSGLASIWASPWGDEVMVDERINGVRFYCAYSDASNKTLVVGDAAAIVSMYLPTKGIMGIIPFKKVSDATTFVSCYKMLADSAGKLSFERVGHMEEVLLKALGDVKYTEPKPMQGEVVFATTMCEHLDFSRAGNPK